MAVSVAPVLAFDANGMRQSRPELSPSALGWLDTKHPEFIRRDPIWEIDERRFEGGAEVKDEELQPFDYEEKDDDHHKARKREAVFPMLPLAHALKVTGHLRKHAAPRPGKGYDFGNLGEVREREKIDTPTKGELFYYNVDGVGGDGSSLPAFLDFVDQRAQVYGHMFVMAEASENTPRSFQDEIDGDRPFAVPYTPREVHNYHFTKGQAQFYIIRTPIGDPELDSGGRLDMSTEDGYYLLVRRGWRGFGDYFAQGGWWLFDSEKKYIRDGRWNRTRGEIPMVVFYGRMARGTKKNRAMSASDTTELGALAVEIMNVRSARKYDYWDAASSKTFFLNADADVMKHVVPQWQASHLVGVPPHVNDKGETQAVTVHDGSTGAVAAAISDAILKEEWETARQISVDKIIGVADSSGESKEVGFQTQSVPQIVQRIYLREMAENSLLRFIEMRWGYVRPRAYAQWKYDIDLLPLVDDIDKMFDTLRRASVTSGSLEVEMIMTALMERIPGMKPSLLTTIRNELVASVEEKKIQQEADLAILRGEAPPAMNGKTPGQTAGTPLTGAAAVSAGGGIPSEDDDEGTGITARTSGGANDGADAATGGRVVGAIGGGTAPISDAAGGEQRAVRPVRGGSPSTPDRDTERGTPAGGDGRAAERDTPSGSDERREASPRSDASAPTPRAEERVREAPTVDMAPVTARVDALGGQLTSLLAALQALITMLEASRLTPPPPPPPPPAKELPPVIIDIRRDPSGVAQQLVVQPQ